MKAIFILIFVFQVFTLYPQTPRDSILNCIIEIEQKLGFDYLQKMQEVEIFLLDKGYLKSANRNGYIELFNLLDSSYSVELFNELKDSIFTRSDYWLSSEVITTCYTLTPFVIYQYDKTGSDVLFHIMLYHFYDNRKLYSFDEQKILNLLIILTPYTDDFLRHNLLFVFLQRLYEKHAN